MRGLRIDRDRLIVSFSDRDHTIERVSAIFEQTSEQGHVGLRVQSEPGRTTLLRFRAPAFPEELDGIAPGEL